MSSFESFGIQSIFIAIEPEQDDNQKIHEAFSGCGRAFVEKKNLIQQFDKFYKSSKTFDDITHDNAMMAKHHFRTKKEKNRWRMQQHRARLTPEQRQAEREADAARHRERRLLQALKNEDNHEWALTQNDSTSSTNPCGLLLTERMSRLERQRLQQRQYRARLTPEQRQATREADAARQRERRQRRMARAAQAGVPFQDYQGSETTDGEWASEYQFNGFKFQQGSNHDQGDILQNFPDGIVVKQELNDEGVDYGDASFDFSAADQPYQNSTTGDDEENSGFDRVVVKQEMYDVDGRDEDATVEFQTTNNSSIDSYSNSSSAFCGQYKDTVNESQQYISQTSNENQELGLGDARSFICKVCNRKFANLGNLKQHMKTHDERVRGNPETGQSTNSSRTSTDSFKEHVADANTSIIGEVSIKGGNIGAETKMRRTLYSCEICTKEFYNKLKYTVHVRTHTGEKPHACTICGKKFNTTSQVKRHMMSSVHSRLPSDLNISSDHSVESSSQLYNADIIGGSSNNRTDVAFNNSLYLSSTPHKDLGINSDGLNLDESETAVDHELNNLTE